VIPRFFDERSCLNLVFATLWRASERWQRVSFTDLELEPGAPEPLSVQNKAV